MGKRVPYTPFGKIKAMLHRSWMWSRERRVAVKRSANRCECCDTPLTFISRKECVKRGITTPRAEVHHIDGVQWKQIEELLRKTLFCNPDRLRVLCPECHSIETEKQANESK